jgi:hypothetical protein
MVDAAGSEAGQKSAIASEWIHAGRPLLAIDAYQTGKAVTPRPDTGRQHLIFNKSDSANRVQDILTGLSFLSDKSAGPVTLAGSGDAAVWCIFAAAVAPSPVKLQANPGNFQGEDNDFIDRFFVPGIQRAGGLSAALRLVRQAKPN